VVFTALAAEHCFGLSQGATQSMLPSPAWREAPVARIYDQMLIARIWSQPCRNTLGRNVTELRLHCMGRNQNFTLFINVHMYKLMFHEKKNSDSGKNSAEIIRF